VQIDDFRQFRVCRPCVWEWVLDVCVCVRGKGVDRQWNGKVGEEKKGAQMKRALVRKLTSNITIGTAILNLRHGISENISLLAKALKNEAKKLNFLSV